MSTDDQPNTDQQAKARRAGRLAIVFLYLLALTLTWSIDGFFVLVCLGAASFFGFLSYYHRPRPVEVQPEPIPSWKRQGGGIQPAQNATGIVRRILLALPFIIGFIIFALVARVIFSSSPEENRTDQIEQIVTESDDAQPIQSDPNDIDALTNTGNDFYNQEQYDSAMKYYERVLQIDPSNQYAQYNKALVFAARKDYSRSIRLIRSCIRQHPDYGYAYYLLGDNYDKLSRTDSAVVCFEQAYQYDVRDADMLQSWADNIKQGNSVRAIALYKEALQQDSTKVELYSRLAELEPSEAERYREIAKRWSGSN